MVRCVDEWECGRIYCKSGEDMERARIGGFTCCFHLMVMFVAWRIVALHRSWCLSFGRYSCCRALNKSRVSPFLHRRLILGLNSTYTLSYLQKYNHQHIHSLTYASTTQLLAVTSIRLEVSESRDFVV